MMWNTGRKLFGVLICLVLMLVLMPGMGMTAYADGNVASVTNGSTTTEYATLANALNNWTNGTTLTLLADVTTDSTISISGTKTLDLNGHGIRMTGSNAVFYLNSNAIFNLNDSGNTVHYITLNDYLFASVSDSGTENIENGTGTVKVTGGYITGGTTSQCNGSAVTCHKSGAVFNMYGGTIIGSNADTKGAVLSGHENSGDNSNRGGTFNMHGGLIAYNKGLGLGVFEYGSAAISGGAIKKNSGHGLQMWAAASLSLSNTEISGNGGYGINVDTRKTAINVSGKVVIQDNIINGVETNVYFCRSDDHANRIKVNSQLTTGSDIGVTLNPSVAVDTGYIFTTSSNTALNDVSCFSSDNNSYAVTKKDDGQLYLVPTRTVTYNANGGGGTMIDSNSPYASGSTVTVLANTLTAPTGSIFAGWKIGDAETIYANSADSITGASGTFTISGDTTLTAQWVHRHTVDGQNIDFKPWTSDNSMPTTAGNYVLTSDVTINNSTWEVPSGTTNLCLNGHCLKRTGTGTGRVVNIPAGRTLNLYDCNTVTTHRFSVNATTHLATLDEDYGSLIIQGGCITGGQLSTKGNQGVNNIGGAGIGVHGTLNMYGGTIIGNYINGDCSGVHVFSDRNANFNMYGGTIRNNYATGNAGGVQTNRIFTMSGGLITENKCDNAGGGMLVQWYDAASFTMTGGTISNNYNVGIFFNYNGSQLKIGSDAVIENNLTKDGTANADIQVGSGTGKIYLTGERRNTTPIYITGLTGGVFTSSSNTTYNDTTKFASTAPQYKVGKNTNGQLILVEPFSVTYDGNGATSGTVPTDETEYVTGVNTTVNVLSKGTLAKNGYSFAGWKMGDKTYANSSDGISNAQTSFTITGNTTLTAQWEPVPATAPTISAVNGANLTYGYAANSGSVSVTATAATDTTYKDLAYQWYSCDDADKTNPQKINGATDANYAIPTGKNAGTTEYYYCVVTATRSDNSQTATATSSVATVTVNSATISSVAVTDITLPAATQTLDTQASTGTEHVALRNSGAITWNPAAPQDGKAAYATVYTATVTAEAATNYAFADNASATVNGSSENVTVTKNQDGTLAISRTFAKTALIPVTITPADKSVSYSPSGISIPVDDMFTISEGAGAASYSVSVETGDTGAGSYSAQTGKLTVTKCGTFTVKASTAETETHAAGAESATLTVNKIAPTVTAPTAKTLAYSGQALELVDAGKTNGGTMQYAIGQNAATAPTGGWSESIPSATNAGTYYVWYKVVGDKNHNDTDPACVTVTVRLQKYTVSYDANGGTNAPAAQTKEYGVTLRLSTQKPSRADYVHNYVTTLIPNGGTLEGESTLHSAQTTVYTFQNWNSSPVGSNTSYAPGASYTENASVTLYAQWTSVTTRSKIMLPVPVREGYTFNGWNIHADAERGATGEYEPTGNRTLYATWKLKQSTITFDTDGGTEIAPITQDYGTEITAPADPTREGYTFAGWNKPIPATMPAEDMTITAQWTADRYTITFETDGGTEIAPITQDYGTAITAPADPTREGYTFAGWNKAIPATMPAEDMTIKASWTINRYTITFDTDGGSEIAPITQDYGTTVTVPADPTKEGCIFAGWNTSADGTGTAYQAGDTFVLSEDTTLHARWTRGAHTGSDDSEKSYSSMEEAIANTPENTPIIIDQDTVIGSEPVPAGSVVTVEESESSEDDSVQTKKITIQPPEPEASPTDAYLVTADGKTGVITDVNVETTGSAAILTDEPAEAFLNVTKALTDAVESGGLEVDKVTEMTLSLSRTPAEEGDARDSEALANIIASADGETSLAFEIHPVVTLTDGENSISYEPGNEDLKGKKFRFRLFLGENFANKAVVLTHYDADGNVTETWERNADANGAVELTMSRFSIVTAAFAEYQITVADTNYGTVTADKTSAVMGESVALTITPDKDCVLDSLSVMQGENEVTVTDGSFIMPAGDVTVTAVFKLAVPRITGVDLVLSGTLDFRFYVELPENFDPTGAYMSFDIHSKLARSCTRDFDESVEIDGKKVYTCPVYSIEMAEPVDAVFHYGTDGKATLTVSIRDYLDKLEEQQGKAEIIDAVRNYGHYMQPYLSGVRGFTVGEGEGYDYQSMPAAGDITPLTELDAYKRVWGENGYDDSVLKSMGYYDSFNESIRLNIRLKFKDVPGTVTATVDGRAGDVRKLSSKTYQVEIPDIAANKLGKSWHVIVTADGRIVYDVHISALSYVSSLLALNRDQAGEREALTAFYEYYEAAKAYKGN